MSTSLLRIESAYGRRQFAYSIPAKKRQAFPEMGHRAFTSAPWHASAVPRHRPFLVSWRDVPSSKSEFNRGNTYIAAAKNTGILHADGELLITKRLAARALGRSEFQKRAGLVQRQLIDNLKAKNGVCTVARAVPAKSPF